MAKEEKRCMVNRSGIIISTTMAIRKEATMTVMAEPVVMAAEGRQVRKSSRMQMQTESQPCPYEPSLLSRRCHLLATLSIKKGFVEPNDLLYRNMKLYYLYSFACHDTFLVRQHS